MSAVQAALKVDPDVLRKVGHTFGLAGGQVAGLGADAPLGEAAGAVPQLATAAACRAAQAEVAAEVAGIASRAKGYAENLATAAGQYVASDEAAGAAIRRISFPDVEMADASPDEVTSAEPTDETAAMAVPRSGPNLIYCYEVSGPDPFLCEGYNDDGPYTFPSPIDVSGVG